MIKKTVNIRTEENYFGAYIRYVLYQTLPHITCTNYLHAE